MLTAAANGDDDDIDLSGLGAPAPLRLRAGRAPAAPVPARVRAIGPSAVVGLRTLPELAGLTADDGAGASGMFSRTVMTAEQFLHRIFRIFPRTRSSAIEYRVLQRSQWNFISMGPRPGGLPSRKVLAKSR